MPRDPFSDESVEADIDESKKEYLKSIDAPYFFDRMLTKVLVYQPEDPILFFKQFVMDTQAGKDTSVEGEYSPKIMEDTVYVRRHNITAIINTWLEDLLRDRPTNYLAYHLNWLNNYRR
eukprot:NODE_9855_length_560_cov_9.212815_g9216_i0.p1 GENE.NODE_9855_length_560_cov_9.212815_g9216_i0~~NODE_9855_length_560_cov_9.212815_g9216_i0.p1  ORF type:complete len:119 (-),score=15.13 NODE_9855_length_560_cov_9.212815_g9216_i0:148-504(-)